MLLKSKPFLRQYEKLIYSYTDISDIMTGNVDESFVYDVIENTNT